MLGLAVAGAAVLGAEKRLFLGPLYCIISWPIVL